MRRLVVVLLTCSLLLCFASCGAEKDTPDASPATQETPADDLWAGITADGVDEDVFLQDMDWSAYRRIAITVETLVAEEARKEQEDPSLAITGEWLKIFDDARYKDILAMGDKAKKPLYWLIYKSAHNGLFEFICAEALYELSGYDFSIADGVMQWDNAKALLPLLNAAILQDRGH